MVYKRKRAEERPPSDDDGMDSDDREALEAFNSTGFDQSLTKEAEKKAAEADAEAEAEKEREERRKAKEAKRRAEQQAEENRRREKEIRAGHPPSHSSPPGCCSVRRAPSAVFTDSIAHHSVWQRKSRQTWKRDGGNERKNDGWNETNAKCTTVKSECLPSPCLCCRGREWGLSSSLCGSFGPPTGGDAQLDSDEVPLSLSTSTVPALSHCTNVGANDTDAAYLRVLSDQPLVADVSEVLER